MRISRNSDVVPRFKRKMIIREHAQILSLHGCVAKFDAGLSGLAFHHPSV